MPNPNVVINAPVFKGNKIDFSGTVDFLGGSGTVVYYLDPQPTGRTLGPFPITPVGNAFSILNLRLGGGKWRVRVVATPVVGNAVTAMTTSKNVNRAVARKTLPVVGGGAGTNVNTPFAKMDMETRAAYSAAIAGASAGTKRSAGAAAIVAAMGANQLLQIFRNGVQVVRAEYTGPVTVATGGGTVKVKTSTVVETSVLANADIETGTWRFIFQGGLNYSREIRGNVGPVGSGADMILSGDTVVDSGFASEFDFLVPTSIDP